jgi:Ca2+-binding RTX toxin-like protein
MAKYLAPSLWANQATGAAALQLDLMSPTAGDQGLSAASGLGTADPVESLAAGLPDLVIDNVEIEGDPIDDGDEYGPNFRPGDTVRLDWAVDNRGSGAAGASRVAIRLISDVDGMVVDTNATDAISAGGSDTGQYDSFTIPSTLSPGLYGIEIVADDQRVVSESSESNNTYLILIRVESGRADLVIDNVEINGTSIGRGDEYGTSVMPGDTIRVDWDVDNNGSAAAGASRVAIRLVSDVDGMVVDTNTTDAISAGGSDTGQYDSFVIPSTLSPGLYGIELIADDQDVVDESSESNNDYLFLIRVGEAPPPPPTGTDEVRQGTDTLHSLPFDELRSGTIEAEPIAGDGVTSDQAGGMVDKDWYKVTLEKGHTYYFGASSVSLTTNSVAISLYADGSTVVAAVREGSAPSFTFDTTNQVAATQTYYLAVSAGGPEPAWRTATGDYAMIVQMVGGTPPPPPPDSNDDFRDTDLDTSAALGAVDPGQSVTGVIGSPDSDDRSGDKDVFVVNLVAGKVYDFHLQGSSAAGAALPSGVFTIRDDGFGQLELSGSGSSVHEYFRADRSGLHYVRVGSGGASTDTGGYRLSIAEVPPSQIADDWADDTRDSGIPGSVNPGGGSAGTIEAPGDKDYFKVNLTAGLKYYFSVESQERGSAGSLDTIALSLRSTTDFFSQALKVTDGNGRTGFYWEADHTGIHYIRVGAGAGGSDTGGYRLSVSTGKVPPPALTPLPGPEPIPGTTALQRLDDFLDVAVRGGITSAIEYFGEPKFWRGLYVILNSMDKVDALSATKIIFTKLKPIATVTDFTAHWVKINAEITRGADPTRVILVEMIDFAAGLAVAEGGIALVPILTAAGALAGPAGAAAGAATGLIAAGSAIVLYETVGSKYVKDFVGWVYDNVVDFIDNSSWNLLASMEAAPPGSDVPLLPRFDEEYYLTTYSDVKIALARGTFGSPLAHYLTVGIDLGYRPNPAQLLTRGDLAFSLVNNDPAVLGNSTLFTLALGMLAGDGIGGAEKTVANALWAAPGPASGSDLDATLSALAHRKALDLVANGTSDPIAAAGATNSVWAASWSDGSDFDQAFNAQFAAVLGVGATASAYRIFVTGSPTGSPADVLARLQAQDGWAPGAFDTFGIAEYGGLWVVIVADRASGASTTDPGGDTLARITVYGDANPNSLYAGTRSANLHGLDGADRLQGSAGNDRLDGGAGNDLLYLTSTPSQTTPASGTVTLQPGPEGQDKWVTNVYYGGGVDDHQLKVGGWGDHYNSLIRFDLSGPGLPTQVTSATVRLYYFSNNGASPTGVLVDKVNTAWTEAYVWNDYPLAYTNLGQIAPSSFGWVDVDVTQAVNGWLANPSSNFGLQLRPTSNNNNFTFFVSSDATGDMAANRPKLVLSWGSTGAPAESDVGIGGPGNDTFLVDSALDQVVEAADEGSDAVYATVSYALAAGSEIELVSTTDREGTAAIDFTGNEFANALYGNAAANLLVGGGGNDHLDGGRGADRLRGGTGDDGYVVDDPGDVVEEFAGEGSDTIWTSLASYSLVGTQVESLGATSDIAHDFRGNSANNGIRGGAGNDLLRLQDGGDDNVDAGDGNDTLLFIGSLTAADIVNGDSGVDTLVLQGNYGSGLTLTGNVTEMEGISLLAGSNTGFGEPGSNRYDYVITTHNSNFAAGVQARINGSALLAGEDFTFDGSAETDASFVVYGGKGKDALTGGLGNDIFFYAEERFASGDTVNGGAGYDGMFLRGNYTIDFTAAGYTGLFTNIENLTLTSATDERYARGGGTEFDYNLTLSDAIVGAGQQLTVSGSLLLATESMIIDAGAETDGTLRLFGGKSNDVLKGGALADLVHGNLGADILAGGGGADVFRFDSAADSNAASSDQIVDFTPGTDRIDLSRIDADSNAAGDQAFSWIGSGAFTGAAGQLRAVQQGGGWTVQGDTNGDGVADLVIALTLQGAAPLGAGDFLL